MLSIVFPWSNGVKCFIVNAAKSLSAVNIFPDPFRKFGLNQLLPILSNGSFLLVQHPNLIAVGINFGIEDADILLVQGLLKNVVGINSFGAVGGNALILLPSMDLPVTFHSPVWGEYNTWILSRA